MVADELTYRQKNAAKARQERTRRKQLRYAQELREAGWQVIAPTENVVFPVVSTK